MRRGRCAPLAVCVVALGACGGSGEEREPAATSKTVIDAEPAKTRRFWPKPLETPGRAVARIQRTVRAAECEAGELVHGGGAGLSAAECRRVFRRFRVDDLTVYGSAAVVDHPGSQQSILALDADGRFKLATAFANSLAKVPRARADEAMAYAVSAIRRGNCEELLEIAMTFEQGGAGQRFCERPRIRRLRRALQDAYTADPKWLGGNGSLALYGLRVKEHGYFTLLFASHENGGYLFVDGYPA